MALKQLIANRGRASVIYSDNVKTFIAVSTWIVETNKDKKRQEYLISEQIKCRFSLTRAPWWGEKFKRIVTLMKRSLFKATESTNVTKQGLEEILLDIEVVLSNGPVVHIEGHMQMPL